MTSGIGRTPALALQTTTAPKPAADETETPLSDGVTPSSKRTDLPFIIDQMATSVGSVSKDMADAVGVDTDDGIDIELGNAFAVAGGFTGIAGVQAMIERGAMAREGIATSWSTTASDGASILKKNSLRLTPTLVSAIAGPALADGVSYIAPKLVPKYDKKKKEEHSKVKISRAVVAGAAVGIAGGIAFLVKPELFKSKGFNVVSEQAIKGFTEYKTSAGAIGQMSGIRTAADILEAAGPALEGKSIEILRTGAPMVRDAAFSNRMVLGAVGGIGTALLANKAAESEGSERNKWGAAAAVTGALTIGGIAGMGKMTDKVALLQGNEMLWKPNKQWFKDVYGKITAFGPVTAIPAGTSASQYYNIVSDFDDITSTRSPFRK